MRSYFCFYFLLFFSCYGTWVWDTSEQYINQRSIRDGYFKEKNPRIKNFGDKTVCLIRDHIGSQGAETYGAAISEHINNNWTKFTRLSNFSIRGNDGLGNENYPTLATSGTTTLIAWEYYSSDLNYGFLAYKYTNNGEDWSPVLTFNNDSNKDTGIQLVAFPDYILGVWLVQDSLLRNPNITVATFSNNVWNSQKVIAVTNSSLDWPVPDVACLGFVCVVTFITALPARTLGYVVTEDGGRSFSEIKFVPKLSSAQYLPRVSVNSRGIWVLIWNEGTNVVMAMSHNISNGFELPSRFDNLSIRYDPPYSLQSKGDLFFLTLSQGENDIVRTKLLFSNDGISWTDNGIISQRVQADYFDVDVAIIGQEWHVVWTSVFEAVRTSYRVGHFEDDSSGGSSLENSQSSSIEKSNNSLKIILSATISIGVIFAITAILVAVFIVRRKSFQDLPSRSSSITDKERSPSVVSMDYTLSYSDINIKEELGSGEFGVVYRGEYKFTEVAVKKLKRKEVSNEELKAFNSECSIMYRLPPHPNVVQFRGVTVPPDPWCIITDYCQMGSLKSLLNKAQSPLTGASIIRLAQDIARGMLHLHTALPGTPVIHKDLAARNILLKKDGTAAVADFGLAKLGEENSITEDENAFGAAKWMPPEFALKVFSVKTDIFSYAVTVWEIVTRSDPWPGKRPGEAFQYTLEGKRPSIPAECPSVVKEVITRCWAQNSEDRPDFNEVLSLLNHQF